jgi:hypothetical protein
MSGILAIWNDCSDGQEAIYEAWYQGEHLFERVGTPGFLYGRRYEALDGEPRYFTYYETESPDTLTSPPYLERVEDPTPLTQRVMRGVFVNSSRTVCEERAVAGEIRGSCVVAARAVSESGLAALQMHFDAAQLDERMTRKSLWISAEANERTASAEEQIRGMDEKISGCLLYEALRGDVADGIALEIRSQLGEDTEVGVYRLLCEYRRELKP